MDQLGISLEEAFNNCGRKFTLKTVLLLADQMIQRLEFVHSWGYIHRDIKPDNFLIGVDDPHYIYIVDFGLAKRFYDFKLKKHIPFWEGKSLIGTVRYASVKTHLGIEQSWRDDLESLGFVLIYFLKGDLPWMGLKATDKKDKYDKIK